MQQKPNKTEILPPLSGVRMTNQLKRGLGNSPLMGPISPISHKIRLSRELNRLNLKWELLIATAQVHFCLTLPFKFFPSSQNNFFHAPLFFIIFASSKKY